MTSAPSCWSWSSASPPASTCPILRRRWAQILDDTRPLAESGTARVKVEGIDLWLFGGLAKLSRDSESPGEEFRVAAAGHRTLCLGQGAELCWARDPKPLSSTEVLDIFRKAEAGKADRAARVASTRAQRRVKVFMAAIELRCDVRVLKNWRN